MALYDLDRFRRFVLESRFLQIFHVEKEISEKIETDDLELMKLAHRWLEFGLIAGETLKMREDMVKDKDGFKAVLDYGCERRDEIDGEKKAGRRQIFGGTGMKCGKITRYDLGVDRGVRPTCDVCGERQASIQGLSVYPLRIDPVPHMRYLFTIGRRQIHQHRAGKGDLTARQVRGHVTPDQERTRTRGGDRWREGRTGSGPSLKRSSSFSATRASPVLLLAALTSI